MLMILNSRKKIRNFIEALSKPQLKRLKFIVISDDLKKNDFPKKMEYDLYDDLLPPSYMIVNLIQDNDKEKYANDYTEYLLSNECQQKLLYIIYEALTCSHVILCFGDTEKEFDIDVYIKSIMQSIVEDLRFLKYKDFKDNVDELFDSIDLDEDNIVDYVESKINNIKASINGSISDPFDESRFYID